MLLKIICTSDFCSQYFCVTLEFSDTIHMGYVKFWIQHYVFCSTTGTRDPITSALHIVLGKRVHLDIAQVVRWKTTSRSEVEPSVRYAASFSG